MNDSVSLLQEACSGCKYAVSSINTALDYVKDEQMQRVIKKYDREHSELGERCRTLLKERGAKEKRQSAVPEVMSRLGINMRLSMNDSKSHVAEIMINGCNMGMKTLAKERNRHPNAASECVDLTNEIIALERSMMADMLKYL
ncbi:MAG: hypothetical protein IJY65_01010 [Clostridia bacterium]|nr:hypothetical protein [Clostridia bacterium]